jgi:hypothetical protein
MTRPRDKVIAARAYKLSESQRQVRGKEDEFWHAAEQQLLNEDKSNPMRTPNTI